MNIYRLHIYYNDAAGMKHRREDFPIFAERLSIYARNAAHLESPDDVMHIYILDDANPEDPDRGRIIQASGHSAGRGWFIDEYGQDGRPTA